MLIIPRAGDCLPKNSSDQQRVRDKLTSVHGHCTERARKPPTQPDTPSGNGDHAVENSPDRPEYPIGRVEGWLHQRRIPVCHAGGRDHSGVGGNAKTYRQKKYQAAPNSPAVFNIAAGV